MIACDHEIQISFEVHEATCCTICLCISVVIQDTRLHVMLISNGTLGRKRADNDHSVWCRIRLRDLKYSQDTCSEVLPTYESRRIQLLKEKLSDDPDEVLMDLGISPEIEHHAGASRELRLHGHALS